MSNMYFEFSSGVVTDVSKSVAKDIYFGMKYILQGGDNVVFTRLNKGICVVRSKGTNVKVERYIETDGTYLLTPVYLEPVKKLNNNYRKLYGTLRESLKEKFFLTDNLMMDTPYQVFLNLEIDIIIKYRLDVEVNTNILSLRDIQEIKYLTEQAISMDLKTLVGLSDKNLLIKIDRGMISKLNSIVDLSKQKYAI